MASNPDPKPASGKRYFFMAALFCAMLLMAVYAMLAIINMADNGQAQTAAQVFEMPSDELDQLSLNLRDDISPFLADPVEKKAIEKLDAAIASKAAVDWRATWSRGPFPSPVFTQRHEVSGIFS
jgi:hypothetical protein